jgi:hypothetical protein
LKSKGLKRVE